jgi:hypothetical protein
LAWLKSSFSAGLPTKSQTILLMIVFILSNEKARSVWERTLPREETLKESEIAASSSGASHRNDVVLTESPIKVFDGDAALLRHFFEGFRPADCLLNVADTLIREASKHNKGSHRASPYGHPIQPSH